MSGTKLSNSNRQRCKTMDVDGDRTRHLSWVTRFYHHYNTHITHSNAAYRNHDEGYRQLIIITFCGSHNKKNFKNRFLFSFG